MNNTDLQIVASFNTTTIQEYNPEEANTCLSEIHAIEKRLTEHKEELTKPLKTTIKEINSRYSDAEEKIAAIKQAIKDRIIELSKQNPEEVKTTIVKMQKLSIVDANAIPRELLIPDEKAILAILKTGTAVPGCEIIIEESVRAK